MTMLERLLSRLFRPRPARNEGRFWIVSVTPTRECRLMARRTVGDAEAALQWVIDSFRRAGFMLLRRDRSSAQMSKYLSDLDIFIEIDLVVEYVADPTPTSARRANWYALRRLPLSPRRAASARFN